MPENIINIPPWIIHFTVHRSPNKREMLPIIPQDSKRWIRSPSFWSPCREKTGLFSEKGDCLPFRWDGVVIRNVGVVNSVLIDPLSGTLSYLPLFPHPGSKVSFFFSTGKNGWSFWTLAGWRLRNRCLERVPLKWNRWSSNIVSTLSN